MPEEGAPKSFDKLEADPKISTKLKAEYEELRRQMAAAAERRARLRLKKIKVGEKLLLYGTHPLETAYRSSIERSVKFRCVRLAPDPIVSATVYSPGSGDQPLAVVNVKVSDLKEQDQTEIAVVAKQIDGHPLEQDYECSVMAVGRPHPDSLKGSTDNPRWYAWPEGLLILLTLVGLNFLLFRIVGGVNYFVWYLHSGSLIAILFGFLSRISEGLRRDDLLSAHPLAYLRGCSSLGAIFSGALGAHFSRRRDTTKDSASERDSTWDGFTGLFTALLMLVAVFAWLLIIAPLNYFITLITGSLAREELRGSSMRAIAKPEGRIVKVDTQPREKEIPDGTVDVSLTKDPFAITQAITALVLWIGSVIYESLK